jgi:hypothetical protein
VAADLKISWPWTVSIVMLPDRRFRPRGYRRDGPARGKADTRGTCCFAMSARTRSPCGERICGRPSRRSSLRTRRWSKAGSSCRHVADEPPRNGRLLPVKRAGACTAEVRGSNPLRSTRKSARIALGSMKGVGRIYQQTFIDTSAKVALTRYAHVETGAT